MVGGVATLAMVADVADEVVAVSFGDLAEYPEVVGISSSLRLMTSCGFVFAFFFGPNDPLSLSRDCLTAQSVLVVGFG